MLGIRDVDDCSMFFTTFWETVPSSKFRKKRLKAFQSSFNRFQQSGFIAGVENVVIGTGINSGARGNSAGRKVNGEVFFCIFNNRSV